MSASSYAQREAEEAERARLWLQNLLGLDVEHDFFEALGDGVLLCSIVNTIKPGTIPKVNPSGRAKKNKAKKMDNINNFINGARRIGVLKSYLFEVDEFVAQKRPDKLIKCLIKLEEVAKKAGIEPGVHGEIVLEMQRQVEEEDLKKEEAHRLEEEAKEREREEREREYHERMKKLDEEIEHLRLEEQKRLIALEEAEKDMQKRKEMVHQRERAEKEKKEQIEKERIEREKKAREEREAQKKKEQDAKKAATATTTTSTSTASSSSTASSTAHSRPAPSATPKAAAPRPSPSASFGGPPKRLTGADALLYWAQQCCGGYEQATIENFSSSWKDGIAFCALVHYHFPKEFDYKSILSKTPAERLELAFDTAGKMGVPPLLDPEDVYTLPTPDKRSIMTYLGCLFQSFKR